MFAYLAIVIYQKSILDDFYSHGTKFSLHPILLNEFLYLQLRVF